MGTLYLVPTPVGNLEDITLRAITTLKACDLILCEDTRVSKILLNHFGIEKALFSYHQHNEHKVLGSILEKLKHGENIALITDAGTPGISDPGFLVARAAIQEDLEVICLPGPTAFIPALVQSGLPCERFCFEGFLPQKKGRKTRLLSLANEERTMIFYESPHRILKTLNEFKEVFGEDRLASVSRELSKKFEETQRGTFTELINYFSTHTVKGEFTVVVAGKG